MNNRYAKIILTAVLVLAMILSMTACGGSGTSSDNSGSDKTVIVGSKDFTENNVVAEIYALALEDAGFTVERKMNIAGSVVHTSFTS